MRKLKADGIEGILATIITDSVEALCAKLRGMVRYREMDPVIGSMVKGFHVEGPFLNAEPGYIGAHPPQHVVPANPDDAARILEALESIPQQVGPPPEWGTELTAEDFRQNAKLFRAVLPMHGVKLKMTSASDLYALMYFNRRYSHVMAALGAGTIRVHRN